MGKKYKKCLCSVGKILYNNMLIFLLILVHYDTCHIYSQVSPSHYISWFIIMLHLVSMYWCYSTKRTNTFFTRYLQHLPTISAKYDPRATQNIQKGAKKNLFNNPYSQIYYYLQMFILQFENNNFKKNLVLNN